MKKWTIEDFKQYVRQIIDKYYYDTASMIVLRSFYIGEVEKPKDVTVKLFFWLRSIAEKEMLIYKSQLSQYSKTKYTMSNNIPEKCEHKHHHYYQGEANGALHQCDDCKLIMHSSELFPEKKEETQEELWNEAGEIFYLSASFKTYPHVQDELKLKFTITRK